MMSTILTLIVLGMVFQGVLAVLDSILDAVSVNSMLKGLPVIGANLNLIWAYLFVAITGDAIGGMGHGTQLEVLGMSDFGSDVAMAIAILAFIPVKDAVISAISKGVAR